MAQRKLPLKKRTKKVKVKAHPRRVDLSKLPPRDKKGRFKKRRKTKRRR
jgi:hypothetical protein